jgi:hypothetical protein
MPPCRESTPGASEREANKDAKQARREEEKAEGGGFLNRVRYSRKPADDEGAE